MTLGSHSGPWGKVFPNIYTYTGYFFHSAARCDTTNAQSQMSLPSNPLESHGGPGHNERSTNEVNECRREIRVSVVLCFMSIILPVSLGKYVSQRAMRSVL